MAHIYADRVKEASITTGTAPFTLAGADPGYVPFSAVMNTLDICYYVAVFDTEWEVGLGTFTSPNILARTTVLASTNGGTWVSFPAGTKTLALTAPADFFASRKYTDAEIDNLLGTHTHVEDDITDLDKYSQLEIQTYVFDGGYF